METSSIILLVISASISFGLGRTIVYFRNKKQKARTEQAQKKQAQVLHGAPAEPESKNKGKRKRQVRKIDKTVKKY